MSYAGAGAARARAPRGRGLGGFAPLEVPDPCEALRLFGVPDRAAALQFRTRMDSEGQSSYVTTVTSMEPWRELTVTRAQLDTALATCFADTRLPTAGRILGRFQIMDGATLQFRSDADPNPFPVVGPMGAQIKAALDADARARNQPAGFGTGQSEAYWIMGELSVRPPWPGTALVTSFQKASPGDGLLEIVREAGRYNAEEKILLTQKEYASADAKVKLGGSTWELNAPGVLAVPGESVPDAQERAAKLQQYGINPVVGGIDGGTLEDAKRQKAQYDAIVQEELRKYGAYYFAGGTDYLGPGGGFFAFDHPELGPVRSGPLPGAEIGTERRFLSWAGIAIGAAGLFLALRRRG